MSNRNVSQGSRLRRFICGVTSLFAAAATACSAPCSHVGCQNQEHLVFSVPRATNTDIDAELCRNDACAQALFTSPTLQTDGDFLVNVRYDGPSTTQPSAVTCAGSADRSSVRCSVMWTLATIADFEMGDELSIRLSTNGEELSFRSGRTEESHALPSLNGEECGATCEYSTVDVSE
jgi:hypothetical protein